MKIWHFIFIILLSNIYLDIQAEETNRFYLDLVRPPPKTGDETERNVQVYTTVRGTNFIQNQQSVTNISHFFEFRGREKVLNWDESNGWARVEIVVEHFVDGDINLTNELVKPGTRLLGTAIADEMFFKSEDGIFSAKAGQLLSQKYDIRPRGLNEFGYLKISQPRVIGESWSVGWTDPKETEDPLGRSYFQNLNTNNIETTAHFIGITNYLGFNCFHLQLATRIAKNELPQRLISIMKPGWSQVELQENIITDLIVPFDVSQRLLMKCYSIDCWISAKTTVNSTNFYSQSRSSLKVIATFQPIMHQ